MGKFNFIRRFVPDFAKIGKPIHNMLKSDRTFWWDSTFESDFQQIKNSISSSPTLETPNILKVFIIYTNATEQAISVILLQNIKDDIEQPINFMSQSFSDMAMKYSYMEKHAYSLMKSIEKFWHLILGKHTKVRILFLAVKFLLSQNFLSEKLEHWSTKIQEHDLTWKTSWMIKGHDLSLHLSQYLEDS